MFSKSLKSKAKVQKEDEITKIKNRSSSFGRIMFTVFVLIVIIGVFMYTKYMANKRIAVIKLTENVTAGDVVNVETSFRKHEMLYAAYKEEGLVEIKHEDGTSENVQKYVLWKDRKNYEGWYFNNYQEADTNFTITSASEEMQYKNPMLESMPVGNEEYVLDINSKGIDTHQLFPGTTLRMRVAFEVPLNLESECRKAVSGKTVYDGTSSILKVLSSYGYKVNSNGANDRVEGDTFGTGSSATSDDGRTTVVSEVIFDSISAVDMLSSSNESIFEVYMALLKMPVYQRTPYLQTSFSDDKSSEFRSRITPKSLVLSLTREEANSLHEFESMGYDTKWTIIKTDSTSDMLKDFIEINEQLVEAGK